MCAEAKAGCRVVDHFGQGRRGGNEVLDPPCPISRQKMLTGELTRDSITTNISADNIRGTQINGEMAKRWFR